MTPMTSLRTAFVGVVTLAALLMVTAAQAEAQSFKWWKNDRFQRELALTPEQVARLEEIYQAAGPAMRAQKAALDRLQSDLSAMVTDARADDAAAADLIARVESARADLGRTRGVMLYRMRRLLTSDQHTKLKVLFDEHERSRRGHSRPPDRR
jgi:Spy/CpxP family protein refolding chaperone